MAYDKKVWDKVRLDYEVHSISFGKLSKAHGMAKSAIITRSRKEEWVKGKTDQLIQDKVLITQETLELEKKTAQLTTIEAKEVEKAVSFALEMNGIYQSLEMEIAKKTQDVVAAVDVENPMASMTVKNLAQTLQVLKDKEKPTTQVNIQNNTSVMTDKDLDMEIDRVLEQLAD